MDVPLVYAIVVAGIFALFLLRHVHKLLVALIWSRRVCIFLHRHLYPALIRRNWALPQISRINVLLQLIYWAGTVVSNTIGVSGLAEGSSRAGVLAVVNLIPLLFSDRLSFAADLFSLSRRTYVQIHKAMGVMAVLQLTTHMVLEALGGRFVINKPKSIYGLLVRLPPLVLDGD